MDKRAAAAAARELGEKRKPERENPEQTNKLPGAQGRTYAHTALGPREPRSNREHKHTDKKPEPTREEEEEISLSFSISARPYFGSAAAFENWRERKKKKRGARQSVPTQSHSSGKSWKPSTAQKLF